MKKQAEFSDKRCSLCGSLRLTTGVCSLVSHGNIKGCPDPMHDYNAEKNTPRNPSAGDKVLISFGVTNHLCEVVHPWLQLHWLSPDGHTAVVVKEYPGKIYPHKSKGDGAPYWEWPA